MLRLVGVGVGVEEFQWSEDEQVWPFEKAKDGSTLYCKEVDFGALPNHGLKQVTHGISNMQKPFSYVFISQRETGDYNVQLDTTNVWSSVDSTTINSQSNADVSFQPAVCRIIYFKSS